MHAKPVDPEYIHAPSANARKSSPPGPAKATRKPVAIGATALLVAAGFLLWQWAGSDGGEAAAGAGNAGRGGGAPLSVTGVQMAPVPFDEDITANGTLRAEESIELQAEVNGKLVALNFAEGQLVKKGDLLVKIDDSTLQASMRRGLARRNLATVREQRLANLIADGGVSQLAFDEAQAELAVIDAELDAIRAEIAKTEIRAPFDGVVGIRFVSVGAYVNPNTRIATLQGIERLKVDFSVPERYAAIVRPGDPMRFTVAGEHIAYTGEVYAVEPRVDVSTRSILIRAVANNPGNSLLPGNFARVEYTVQKNAAALLVPAIAMISGLEERFVFVARDGKAERLSVEVGARTPTHVQIREGLQAGDVVITTGVQQLRHGLPVNVSLEP